MEQHANAETKEQEREQLVQLGSDVTKGKDGSIYTLTIIGQVEGHQVLPDNCKTTKYEHVLPLLAGIEESDDIDGLLLLLNTVGNDRRNEEAHRFSGSGRRTLHRYSTGCVHQEILYYANRQYDRPSRPHDRSCGGRTPDLSLFSAHSGANRGVRSQ